MDNGPRDDGFRVRRSANHRGIGNLRIGLEPNFRLDDSRRGMAENAVDLTYAAIRTGNVTPCVPPAGSPRTGQ